MQDDYISPPPANPRPRTGRLVLTVAVLAFLAGALGAGWLAWQGSWQQFLPAALRTDPELVTAPPPPPATALPAAAPALMQPAAPTLGSVETRLALLEERLSRIDVSAEAASGNAARAEGLLIAFAARRLVDRGAALGSLEDQLRLRFGDAQPNAVQTVIEAAKQPVTLDELVAQLDVAGPALAHTPTQEDGWTRVKREVASLFTVRTDSGATDDPRLRVNRARILLTAGKVDQAIAEVERLPGARDAAGWVTAARRYATVQRALDLIETTAMLEPRRLRDSAGEKVQQPSPLAPGNAAGASPPDAAKEPGRAAAPPPGSMI